MTDHQHSAQEKAAFMMKVLEAQLRSDLTDEQKLEAARIGRLSFKSAGATRREK
jgi:hypothetical protein